MKTSVVRQKFLDFFAEREHTLVPSSSLIPHDDPTLLFVNAGMVQFKDVFLGNKKPSYQRACSVQRCVRAGGKHNDLENVGHTARHHTFFEMLGNFSFGNYFKREAIQFAWDFVTQVLKLPSEKLWVTVHRSDDEAADIWLNELKVDPKQFSYCGDKDNYWSMGDTGPCGPCTEIFYDHGPGIPGGPPGSPDQEGDRYIEIWNIVFMQNERLPDGSLTPLQNPSIDTGMGLERLAAIMQGVHSNYDIDLFQNLIAATKEILEEDNVALTNGDHVSSSFNVIADHIRSISFLISDGVKPSNEGRGYVLRRIIRRAVRHGQQLNLTKPFLCRLVPALVKEMGAAYSELKRQDKLIIKILKREEEQFGKTLADGLTLLNQAIEKLNDEILPGDLIFKLYDTYGFPADLTADIARERALMVDMAGFDTCMQEQRQRSQQASQFDVAYHSFAKYQIDNEFIGLSKLSSETKVIAMMHDQKNIETLSQGESAHVVLATTPFYGESGGQVGDQGTLQFAEGEARVINTTILGQLHIHHIKVTHGTLRLNDAVTATVDESLRKAIHLNHSATHLLHAALRRFLGDHVQQKGSLVAPDRLRFDFTHPEALTQEQLNTIESIVNEQIRINHEVITQIMTKDKALKSGAMALFNEKYGDTLRVLTMGDFSCEICGGTHVKRTGDIGLFKIIGESGIAAGVRRIEAYTGAAAIKTMQRSENEIQNYAALLQTDPTQLKQKLEQLLQQNRILSKENEQFKAKMAVHKSAALASQAINLAGIKLLVKQCNDISKDSLRTLMDDLKQRLKTAVIVLAVVEKERVHLITGVTTDTIDKVSAAELIKMLTAQIGGRGGGRPDMAQAGGEYPQALPNALKSVKPWIQERIN